MARHSSSNPLAQALDKRVRAVVDEALDEALRGSIRRLIQQELAAALGSAAPPAAIGARRAGRPPGRRVQARGRQRVEEGAKTCEVAGCNRPYRSQGYCAAHYQAARKYGWPMPAPEGFTPPPRPARGRPPKDSAAAE